MLISARAGSNTITRLKQEAFDICELIYGQPSAFEAQNSNILAEYTLPIGEEQVANCKI
jgi:hypothetical protein